MDAVETLKWLEGRVNAAQLLLADTSSWLGLNQQELTDQPALMEIINELDEFIRQLADHTNDVAEMLGDLAEEAKYQAPLV